MYILLLSSTRPYFLQVVSGRIIASDIQNLAKWLSVAYIVNMFQSALLPEKSTPQRFASPIPHTSSMVSWDLKRPHIWSSFSSRGLSHPHLTPAPRPLRSRWGSMTCSNISVGGNNDIEDTEVFRSGLFIFSLVLNHAWCQQNWIKEILIYLQKENLSEKETVPATL